MLDRLIRLRAAVAAPPDVAACPSPGPDAGRGSFPEGTYDMVLENDARSHCTDSPPQGRPGQKSWYLLEVRDDRVTIRQRIDSQAAPWAVAYDGVYSTLRDRIQIGNLNVRWSFDGSALRLSDLTGGSCGDAVIWTTNPWVLRSGPLRRASPRFRMARTRRCSPPPTAASATACRSPYTSTRGPTTRSHPRTWYAELHAGRRSGDGVRERGQPYVAMANMGWVGSYRVYGSTFELTDLTAHNALSACARVTGTS